MQAIDVIKKKLTGKNYKFIGITSKKIKIVIPGGIDFTKTSSDIFNAIVLSKPELVNTEITVQVEQTNFTEMTIK